MGRPSARCQTSRSPCRILRETRGPCGGLRRSRWAWSLDRDVDYVTPGPPPMPDALWSAFFTLLAIGAIVGILCGAGLFSGLALVIFICGALAAFVIWAVANLDPQGLAGEPSYKGEGGKRSGRRS